MTQLVLDTDEMGVVLPECQNGLYRPVRSPLNEDVEMVSGRMVRELRGNVWVIEYQYGYFDDEAKKKVIAACEKGKRESISCGFITPESGNELQYSRFFVTKFDYPKFFWSRNENGAPIPLWGDFSLTLREVKPSD